MNAEMAMLSTNVSGTTYALSKAILVYETTGYGGKEGYATVHGVDPARQPGARPQIRAGVPLTRQALSAVLNGLSADESFGFLPENVLAVGKGYMVWWSRPTQRRVFFQAKEPIGNRAGTTPHPGLVFAVDEEGWSVFAVKGDKRPTPESPLFQAPYFNVYGSGRICTGNVELPSLTTTDAIAAYEEAFFGSNFTHPNIPAKGKLTRHADGPYTLWRELLDGKHRTFPAKCLVPLHQTAGHLVEVVCEGKRP